MRTVKEIRRDIENHRDEIAKLQVEVEKAIAFEAAVESADPEAIAILLHEKTCKYKHGDEGCTWYYEITAGVHRWDRSVHKEYLNKAKCFIKKYGADNISQKLEIAFELI